MMSVQLTIPNKLPVLRRQSKAVGEVIGAFESDTVAVFQRTAPAHERVTLYLFLGMLVFAIALTCVVKLDRVVESVAGIIMTSGGTLYVDPLNPSIVRHVNVKVGQVVKKGQSLATLDPSFTQADLLQMQEHMASDEATVAREEAEIAIRPYIYSTTDRYQSVQGGIWLKRQAQYHSDLASFDGQIASAEAQESQAKSDTEKYTQRLKLASHDSH